MEERTAKEKFSLRFSLSSCSSSAQLSPACCTTSSWPCSPGCASRASTCTSSWWASSTTKASCTATSTSLAMAARQSWFPSQQHSAPSIMAPIGCKRKMFSHPVQKLCVGREVVLVNLGLVWRGKVRLNKNRLCVGSSCWLSTENHFVWSFIGPACLIILVRFSSFSEM